MAPLQDTDVSWEGYELWEAVEARARRKRRLWILSAVAAFLALSSVPIITMKGPQWKGRALARELATQIASLTQEAVIQHRVMRLKLLNTDRLEFAVDSPGKCQSNDGTPVRVGKIGEESDAKSFVWVSADQALKLGLNNVVMDFCYDPVEGNSRPDSPAAIVIAPKNDLLEERMDRMALVRVSSSTAEITFE